MASKTIGFIGLGIMGRGMALNLLKSGASMVVWNRTASKCDEFVEAGATAVKTPMEVVQMADITYSMLSTPEIAKSVFYDTNGTLAGISEGKKLVDCATLDPATMQDFEAAVKAKGGVFLEAPVSGSKGPAAQGSLVMMCAGDKALFEEIKDNDLDLVGKASFYLGDVGKASQMKLAVNMVMGQMMVSFSEGISLTAKAGLPEDAFVEILGLGAMACPMYKGKGPGMIKGEFPTQFPLKHQAKDVRLACALGKEVGQPLPVAEATNKIFEAALEADGEQDFSAVLNTVKKSAQ